MRRQAVRPDPGVEPVGNYAVKLVFDDMHDTGIFGWGYLHALGREYGPAGALTSANSPSADWTVRPREPSR